MAEVYEVATFYAHFDVVADGEPRPPAGDGARLRQPELHAGRRREAAGGAAGEKLPGVRVVRAPCIGSCHTAPAAEVGHHHVDHATPAKLKEIALRAATCIPQMPRLSGLRRLREGRRLCRAALLPVRRAQGRGRDRGAVRRRPARPRRRGLSDGAQMGPGARREGAAPDGGQRRRRRARHLQGPHLPRERAAQVPRRHADRGLGGGGRAGLHLHARRISGRAEDPAEPRSPSSRRRALPSTPRSTCAAAPAPTSAAKRAP